MVLHLVIFALLITSFVFTIIELGLSGHIVSVLSKFELSSTDSISSTYNYLVFCSVWTLLVTALLLVWPFFNRSQLPARKDSSEKWLAPLMLALNFVTMVFWLAAFSSLANLYDGLSVRGVAGAQEAFAVLLWLLFLALLVLNFLTAFGVYKVDRAGHSRIFSGAKVDGVRNLNETAQVA
ncbi:hypothetical protein DV736_g3629, partial [Chaetothyriales sp. CBS 134916]